MKVRKVAVITGGNRGIGLGIAKKFIEDGWLVVIGCRNPETLPKSLNVNDSTFFQVKKLWFHSQILLLVSLEELMHG